MRSVRRQHPERVDQPLASICGTTSVVGRAILVVVHTSAVLKWTLAATNPPASPFSSEVFGEQSARSGVGSSSSTPSQNTTSKPFQNTILPYSVYNKYIQQQQLRWNGGAGEPENQPLTPRVIYLPSHRSSNGGGMIRNADGESAGIRSSLLNAPPTTLRKAQESGPSEAGEQQQQQLFSSQRKNPIRAQSHRNAALEHHRPLPIDGYEKAEKVAYGGEKTAPSTLPYSTSATRETLPFQKSIYNNNVETSDDELEKENAKNVNRLRKISHSHISSAADGTPLTGAASTINHPETMFTAFGGGDGIAERRSNHYRYTANGAIVPAAVASRHIVPAPYPRLSSSASDANIVDSIFQQSQTRYSPLPRAPLSGSPFDLFPAGGGSGGAAPPQLPANAMAALNPIIANMLGGGTGGGAGGGSGAAAMNPLQLLGQGGSTLEQISRIAKNLIAMTNTGSGGSAAGVAADSTARSAGGNSELLSAISKVLSATNTAEAARKLTSSAVLSQPKAQLNKDADDGNKTSAADVADSVAISGNATTLTSSSATSENGNIANTASALKLLSGLPADERELLEAAVKNGELSETALSALLPSVQNNAKLTGNGIIRGENKLLEWIQQNRHRSSAPAADSSGATKIAGGTDSSMNSAMSIASDRLPYYGRYCGSFVEQSATKRYNVGGAVWAASGRRLLISKFNFRPGSRVENITFWAGPRWTSGGGGLGDPTVDGSSFPSENGFYLKPHNVDVNVFMVRPVQKIPAKIRPYKPTAGAAAARTPPLYPAAETEEEPPHESSARAPDTSSTTTTTTTMAATTTASRLLDGTMSKKAENAESLQRAKRTLYEDLLRQRQYANANVASRSNNSNDSGGDGGGGGLRFTVNSVSPSSMTPPTAVSKWRSEDPTTTTLVVTPSPNLLQNLVDASMSVDASLLFSTTTTATTPAITAQRSRSTATFIITAPSSASLPTTTAVASRSLSSAAAAGYSEDYSEGYLTDDDDEDDEAAIPQPLEWYAGFQPLLLQLPRGRSVGQLSWLSLYDHNKKQAVAYVMIPNGVAFQVPEVVQLRPFSANSGYQISSGPIKVLDTKTIEISNFSLTTNGVPVWFMVGKEILPNANGNIVPLFDRRAKSFDCDSLRDHANETLTLRLPGALEIRDVFWFSVFSIPGGVSMAHMHLPYNEIHSPPDLLPIATPECVYSMGG